MEVPSSEPSSSLPDSPSDRATALGISFRQARREMWLMLAAWVVFFLWVTLTCSELAFTKSGGLDEPGTPAIIFGMPRWVVWGVALPWIVANAFIVWFALGFMKDSPLPDGPNQSGDEEPGRDQ